MQVGHTEIMDVDLGGELPVELPMLFGSGAKVRTASALARRPANIVAQAPAAHYGSVRQQLLDISVI
jgi:hypothetical protein